MARSFGLVDYKVQEAEYFLLELKRLGQGFNLGAIQFCASAFVSAARSITFAMQASLKGDARFDAWYEQQRKKLRGDPLARFFHVCKRYATVSVCPLQQLHSLETLVYAAIPV